jgi:tetratricopeptide (TPR) repeat protein
MQDVLERARGSAQIGDHEEAERLLKNYLAKNPDSREARLLLGTTFAREGKLTESADEFTTLLAKDPQDIEALNNTAVIFRRQGRLQDALDALITAIDINPTKAEFHYNIGNIHKQMGDLKAASMAYAKVIELNPVYVPAYNNLGTIYDQLKEYDKAYGVFRKGLALDHNNPTLHFNYGVALEANGKMEDAANEYRAAIRSKPGWLEPMNNLGIIHFKQGRHDKAVDTFNRILDMDPFNAEARNNMGVVQADQGRIKEAIQNYRRAIEADPRYTRAVVNLERVLEESGDFADAVLELEKLVKLTPDSPEVRNRLAGLYLKMERYPEALEQAQAALEWDPESIQALRVQGAVQRVTGQDEEAKASFEKILSIDPGNYAFQLDLADIHFRRKEYKEAEERIQAYLARRPNDRGAKLLLGKLYAEMGNRTHAIQVFEELSRADPNDAEALAAQAELLKEAGSLEKALRTADTLVNLQGKRATSEDLSELNKSLEFYENAVSAYSSSVKEMWDRNMKLLSGGAEEETAGADTLSLLLGASGMTQEVDEETEALFIEDSEYFDEVEAEDGLFDAGGGYAVPEDSENLSASSPENSLDSLAEPEDFPGEARGPVAPGQGGAPKAQEPASQDSVSQEPQVQEPAPQPPQVDPSPSPPPPPSPSPSLPQYQPPKQPEPAPQEETPETAKTAETGEAPLPEEVPLPEEAQPEEAPEEDLLSFDEPTPDLDSGENETLFGGESAEDLTQAEPEELLPDFESEPEPLEEEIPALSEEPFTEEAPQDEVLFEGQPKAEPALDALKIGDIRASDILGLLKNLKYLTRSLPEKDKDNFLKSDCRLSLEFIIDVLEGRKGLFRDIEERKGETSGAIDVNSSPEPQEVAGTLKYLKHLADDLPDCGLSAAITRKAEAVIAELEKLRETRRPEEPQQAARGAYGG